MHRFILILMVLTFGLFSTSYAFNEKIQAKYPKEEPSSALEMVGRYQLTQQNVGTCAKEVTATTRHWVNKDEINTLGITGYDVNVVYVNNDDQLATTAEPSGYYDFRLATLDPDMNFRFGNEFVMLRCRSYSCTAYPRGQKWVLRTFLSRSGLLIINEVTDKTETLDCHYKKVSAPTVAIRGNWSGSLYPESKPGHYSHFYQTDMTIHCSDEGLINGVVKFERMNNGFYVKYAPLAGTCNDGVANMQFTAELENSTGTYEKLTFNMSISEIETTNGFSYMKGATTQNYSVDIFSNDGKKWGNLSKPLKRAGVSHY